MTKFSLKFLFLAFHFAINQGLCLFSQVLGDSPDSSELISRDTIPWESAMIRNPDPHVTNLIFSAQGRIAGVRITGTGSGTGGSTVTNIRGYRFFYGDNQPLFVIDGLPVTNLGNSSSSLPPSLDYDLGDGIGDINPYHVGSIRVISGPEAIRLYGPRGINGAILISAKSNAKNTGIGIEFNTGLQPRFLEIINLFRTTMPPDGAIPTLTATSWILTAPVMKHWNYLQAEAGDLLWTGGAL